MDKQVPLYNSRIPRMYLEYIEKQYPHLSLADILNRANITEYEVNDHGHWFTQDEINNFHEILDDITKNPNLSREVGRYYSSASGMGAARQYLLGLMTVAGAYQLLGKAYTHFSKSPIVETKKIADNKVEVIVTLKDNVKEQPFQCENRMGAFETLARFFTNKYAKIEHPTCYHKGNEGCRYIITWDKNFSYQWKRIRNYTFLFCVPIVLSSLLFVSISTWLNILFITVVFILSISSIADYHAKKELSNILESQGDMASELIDQINISHDQAELIHKIGQAISLIIDIDKLVETIANALEEHLDFDRGVIMLANKEKTRLIYADGYGHSKGQERILQNTAFHLDKKKSRGIFVRTFKKKEPILLDDVVEIQKSLSKRSLMFAEKMDVQSLICVPIIYENKALGIIAVDNVKSKRKLTKSDMNLLLGIAAQTATSINNAISFKKLHESEERFRAIFESSTDSIFVWDRNYTYIYANKASLRQLNKSREEVIGKNLLDVLGYIPELMDTWKTRIDQVFETGEPIKMEDTRSYKDRIIYSESEVSPIKDSTGYVFAVGFVYRDITERKRAKEEKEMLQEQLRQAQKMEAIGTLAGGIAHDFNNILFPIIGYSEMILEDLPEESVLEEDMSEIYKAGMRAKDLVQQILTFSHKHDNQQMPMFLQPVIKEALKLLRAVIPASIEIRTNIDSECGMVMADPMQIHQIIMNLCTNAYHAMRDNGGTLEVDIDMANSGNGSGPEQAALDDKKEYVRLRVKDSGEGMSSDVIERVFEPYFTTKPIGEGTGMGLSIVHGIIKSHEGHIWINSEEGKGTMFEIFLPVTADETDVEEADTVTVTPHGNERILLVDDDTLVIGMIEKMLKRLGYSVSSWTNSLDALETFEKNPQDFDLVISDMNMPNLTGKQLAEKLLIARPDIPIILCTGFSDTIDKNKAKQIGAKDFFIKPASVNDLAVKIRNALEPNYTSQPKSEETISDQHFSEA